MAVPTPAPPPAASPDDAAGAAILVVEDDPRVLASTTAALEEIGYRPIGCPDGRQALALLASAGDIRLILTDVLMPEMTGPELIAAARPLHPQVAVLYVTGYAGEAGDPALFAGDAVLRKPFTIAALERAVAQALASAATASQAA